MSELDYGAPDAPLDECDIVYFGRVDYLPRYIRLLHPATTDGLRAWRREGDVYCMQQVDGRWEVYDLNTMTVQFGTTTIGLPKFIHDDQDAAMMWALMNLSN